MPRHFRLTGVLLLILVLGLVSDAQAQSFGDVVVFGDSLSDSGNVAQALGLPAGSSFTTNLDPVWAEIVTQTFGASGENSLAGGSNYATAGACVNPDTPCGIGAAPTLTEQIDEYLSARPGGRADPDALYAVWGGGNYVTDSLVNGQANAQRHVLAAAAVNVAQVRRLQEAGARHIMVFNLPDVSMTPYAVNLGTTAQEALNVLAAAYNQRLHAGLREHEDGVVPVNVSALFNDILANPGMYGFTDVAGTACGEPNAAFALSFICGPAGTSYLVTYEPGDNQTYLFADRSHPTGAVHAMIAGLATSTLAAPVQVSLAGEAGVAVAEAHYGVVSAERVSNFAQDRPIGSWRAYAAGQAGRSEMDVLPRLGETESDIAVITLGAAHRAGPQLSWGAALSIARHENELSGANLDSDVVFGSLHGAWRRGGLQLDVALSLGRTSVDVERAIVLGPAVRTERGSTEATQFGGELDLGWILGDSGSLRHGPFLGLSWLDQEVKDYRETGNSSTSMNFRDFDRDSISVRAGYQLTWLIGRLRPYARVAYEREFEDDPILVSAGSNTMPGRFTLPGFAPPGDSARAGLGLSAKLGKHTSGLVGYAGRFGDGTRRSHRVSLALRVVF